MSLDRPIHDGRKKDPWQIPHKNRTRWRMWFWLTDGSRIGRDLGVPPPSDVNLRKYRDEVIALNRDDWFRPKLRVVARDEKGNPIRWEPLIDPKTGLQVREARLKKVTAEFLGADV